MKNYLILAAAIAGVMSSCSKEEVVSTEATETSNVIGFTPYSTLNTKGLPINGTTDFETVGNDFGVTAFFNATDGATNATVESAYLGKFTEGAEIQCGGTVGAYVWDYVSTADTRYWPTDGSALDFYAYSPFDGTNRSSDSDYELNISQQEGMSFTNYVVPTAVADQEDFMYATHGEMEKPQTGSKVTLAFKHALTQVRFKAATKSDNMFVVINGLTIRNIQSTGTFSIDAATTTELNSGGTTATEVTGQAGGAWTLPNSGSEVYADYAANINDGTAITISYVEEQIANSEYDEDTNSQVPQTVAQGYQAITNVSTDANTLMLLPQAFTAWDYGTVDPDTYVVSQGISYAETNNQTYIEIECAIYTLGYNSAGELDTQNPIYLLGDANTYKTVYSPLSDGDDAITGEVANTKWQQGYIVTYNLLFDTAGFKDTEYTDPDADPETEEQTLIPIEFTISADGWVDADNGIDVVL